MENANTKFLLYLAITLSCATAALSICYPNKPRTDCGYFGIDQGGCEGRGCCWSPKDNEPWCFDASGTAPSGTCEIDAPRMDCGFYGINQHQCEKQGCCWNPKEGEAWCFHKTSSDTYIISSISQTTLGYKLTLNHNGTSGSSTTPYGDDVKTLQVDIEQQSSGRLHVKITDPNTARWEVPTNLSPVPSPPASPPSNPLYQIVLPESGQPFSFSVIRKSDESVVFESSPKVGKLTFTDQYLSIGTSMPNNYNIYGLGEHVLKTFRLDTPQMLTLFNGDIGNTPIHPNLYGHHPFYLEMRASGHAHGVFLRNGNGMDVILGTDRLAYRTIGGILDLYLFLGPTPEGVVEQYHEVIGRPHMPPYWSLGFHNCRYGYPNVAKLEEVVTKYAEARIPMDTMWTDIDYMDEYKDFTLDPVNFPQDKMTAFVDRLHSNGQRYVLILDPGIKNERGYEAYEEGLKKDIFIKDKNKNVFIGKVWPGTTGFPDFMNFKTHSYWEGQIAEFLKVLPVDGLWIDMNEVSNFCNGACVSRQSYWAKLQSRVTQQSFYGYQARLQTHSIIGHSGNNPNFDPVEPPYTINNFDSYSPLNTRTLDMDCLHMDGTVLEYDAHNLYGLSMAVATNHALENLLNKRSFVLSRSTYPGSGSHTGHWTGDNSAKYDDIEISIVGMLNFQLFGVTMVGSDICGFHGATTEELCTRWMQVGAFYPFSRIHNDKKAPDQEPYLWPQVAEASRRALAIRYSLLPLYYTLFYKAHSSATAQPAASVVRPLFFEFPTDTDTYEIDTQFLVGSSILISPIIHEGGRSRDAYFPEARWYDWFNMSIAVEEGGREFHVSAPIDHIPVHIRGGSVIPLQGPGMTTVESRGNPFGLIVALDESGTASGDVYLDDGESLDMASHTIVEFATSGNTLIGHASGTGYASGAPPLSEVTILGLNGAVTTATINDGKPVPNVDYDPKSQSVQLSGFQLNLATDFSINWE